MFLTLKAGQKLLRRLPNSEMGPYIRAFAQKMFIRTHSTLCKKEVYQNSCQRWIQSSERVRRSLGDRSVSGSLIIAETL